MSDEEFVEEEDYCFNSLFVGMCFAISAAFVSYCLLLTFQFTFRRDVLCNPDPPGRGRSNKYPVSIPFSSGCALQCNGSCHAQDGRNHVSIPFSSGCALQLEEEVPDQTGGIICVSIPFSSGCALQFLSRSCSGCCFATFQFPFRRDVLCNVRPSRGRSTTTQVSIPFSSGCALQCSIGGPSRPPPRPFQFPFRRDVLCNSLLLGLVFLDQLRFNSLFVGMCFAINTPSQRTRYAE